MARGACVPRSPEPNLLLGKNCSGPTSVLGMVFPEPPSLCYLRDFLRVLNILCFLGLGLRKRHSIGCAVVVSLGLVDSQGAWLATCLE